MRMFCRVALRLGLLVSAMLVSATSTAETTPQIALNIADQGAPAFQAFSSKDGLSDEIWSTVGIDGDGFVWAGSASSLAHFDGYRWTLDPLANAQSLVRDMVSDEQGTLWAIFEGEGLASYDGKGWSLSGEQAFFHRFSKTVDAAGRSIIEVGSDHGLLRLVDGTWLPDPASDSPAGNAIVIKTARTRTLFGGPREWRAINSDDLWFREVPAGKPPGPWQRYAGDTFKGFFFTDLVSTHDRGREELWVLSYGNGLVRLRDDGVRMWRAENGELPSEAIYSAISTHSADGERTMWLASRAGLLRFRGDDLRVFSRRDGLPSDAVRGMYLQKSAEGIDILWLATEGGIARAALTPSQWQTVSLLGQSENGVFGLMVEPNGSGGERLWVGSSKEGLAVLEAGQWQYLNARNGRLPGSSVRQVWRLTGPNDDTWRIVSLLGHPLLRMDETLSATAIPTPWPIRRNEAATSALSRRHNGQRELWFGTLHSDAYRLVDDQWQRFGIAGEPAGLAFTGLIEQIDEQGRSWLWAATNRGIARFDGQQFELISATLGLPSGGYRGITLIDEGLPDQGSPDQGSPDQGSPDAGSPKQGSSRERARQVLWASSNRNGVVRLDVSVPLQPSMLPVADIPAAPDPTVYSVVEDAIGRVYICSNNGVQQLTPKEPTGFTSRVFRRRDGLIHDECNTNSQLVDTHDRYWVGTLGGLSVFDPSVQVSSDHTTPKVLHFTAVRVDGQPIEINAANELSIRNGSRELRIDYTLLTGLHEDGSMYRTQLIGYELGPGEWTAEHSRSFTDLSPGNYRLRVEARDYAGTASPGGELTFEIEPLWWQQPITRVLLVSLLSLIAFGLVMLYNRSLRLRQLKLARMVQARTRELNEANLRLTELSYVDPLTGLANRRRLMEVIAAALSRARAQSRPIGLIVLDVDHFKAYNDRHGHLAGDAALRAVAQALETATRNQDLVTRFGGEEFACLLLDADTATVTRIAERMRALVEALPPRALGNDTHTITISAGAVSRVPVEDESADSLLHDADMALYRAKHGGRNQVQAHREG